MNKWAVRSDGGHLWLVITPWGYVQGVYVQWTNAMKSARYHATREPK